MAIDVFERIFSADSKSAASFCPSRQIKRHYKFILSWLTFQNVIVAPHLPLSQNKPFGCDITVFRLWVAWRHNSPRCELFNSMQKIYCTRYYHSTWIFPNLRSSTIMISLGSAVLSYLFITIKLKSQTLVLKTSFLHLFTFFRTVTE